MGQATLADFPWVQESVRAVHASAAMGDSIKEVLNRKRGQPLAGILVASDGAHNMGAQPRTLIKELKESGVPLYFYGVGITSPRDIIVTEMDTPASFLAMKCWLKCECARRGWPAKRPVDSDAERQSGCRGNGGVRAGRRTGDSASHQDRRSRRV